MTAAFYSASAGPALAKPARSGKCRRSGGDAVRCRCPRGKSAQLGGSTASVKTFLRTRLPPMFRADSQLLKAARDGDFPAVLEALNSGAAPSCTAVRDCV